MKIKLCGMMSPEDIQAANRSRPDYIGFILAPSRRRVTLEAAARMRGMLDPGIAAVGVFVNAPLSEVVKTARTIGLDVVQLHGDEDAPMVEALGGALPGIQIWRALRLKDVQVLRDNAHNPAHMLLIDAFTGDAPGGTGKVADWPLLARNRPRRPFFLAGGLHLGNLDDALRLIHPDGVDLSSGIETDGKKDPRKMEAVVTKLRAYGGAAQ